MNGLEFLLPVAGPPLDKAEADIVFVHGLNGDPRKTWCNADDTVFWPSELLPQEFPSARVFCYGYDVMNSPEFEQDKVSDGFCSFLDHLDSTRDERQTPLILIAHSIGGMVVRHALNRLQRSPKSRILDQIRWICFLGTPAFTSDRDWIDFGRAITPDRNPQQERNVSILPRMQSINAAFETWLKTRPKTNPEICCFHEFLKGENGTYVVPSDAAALPGYSSRPILKDHFNFSKLENAIDPLYRTISDHLRSMIERSTFSASGIRNSMSSSSRRTSCTDGRDEALDLDTTPQEAKDPTRLALALEDRGRVQAAYDALTALLHNVLKVPLADATEKDTLVFFCHDKLASVLRKCGRFAEAEEKCLEVLEAKRRVFGRSDPTTLETVGSLGLILRSRGRFHEAIQELTDNLEPSPQYTQQAIVQIKLFSILAKVYKDIGYFSLAELLARDVLIASIRQFGVEHCFTLTRASDLAVVLAKQQKYDFAEELSKRAVFLLQRLLGTDHRYSLRASQRLAFINMLQGKLDEAAKGFERTRLLQQDQLGFLHQSTLATTCGLGTVYLRQGRIEDGEAFLQSALRGQTKLLGDMHPDTLWTAQVLQKLDKSWTRVKPWLPPSPADGDLHEFLRRPSRPQDLHPDFPEIDSIHAPEFTSAGPRAWDFQLRLAALQGDPAALQTALDRGADVNSVGGICGTPLLAASYSGSAELVEALLARGADVNLQGGLFGTPLRGAAFSGNLAIVKRLLDKGASPNIKDGIRGSALCAALITNNAAVVKALLQGGANKYANDDIYGTALHEAAMNGQDELVAIFLDEGANPNLRAGLFGTAIEASAWGGHTATISLLLGHGASLDGRLESRNAIYLASARGNKEALNLLVQKVKELRERARWASRHENTGAAARPGHSPSSSLSGEKGDEGARAEEEDWVAPLPSPPKKKTTRSPLLLVRKCSRTLSYRFGRRRAHGEQ